VTAQRPERDGVRSISTIIASRSFRGIGLFVEERSASRRPVQNSEA